MLQEFISYLFCDSCPWWYFTALVLGSCAGLVGCIGVFSTRCKNTKDTTSATPTKCFVDYSL